MHPLEFELRANGRAGQVAVPGVNRSAPSSTTWSFVSIGLAMALALFACALPAQLNQAYDNGYKPMLDLAGTLRDLADSSSRREDYSAAKDLGANYVSRLERVIAGLENLGRNFRDGDNESWGRSARSTSLSAAKTARSLADELRAKGDNRQDFQGQAKNLQRALTDLSDAMKACWRAHEERLAEARDLYESTRSKWWDATKEDRRPVDDMGKRVVAAREKCNDLNSRSANAGRIYLQAQDQCDKARSELFNSGRDRSPDEVRRRYDEWKTAEDLVKRVAAAAASAEKDAADATRSYNDSYNEWQKAMDNYTKEAAEGDLLYQLVLQRHARLFELAQEYKPFSF